MTLLGRGWVAAKAETSIPSMNLSSTGRTRLELHTAHEQGAYWWHTKVTQPGEGKQAGGEKGRCVVRQHLSQNLQWCHQPPPSFPLAALAISCPHSSFCRFTQQLTWLLQAQSPLTKQPHLWTLYPAPQSILTCSPFPSVLATFKPPQPAPKDTWIHMKRQASPRRAFSLCT